MTTRTKCTLERENAALREQLARHREFAWLLLLWVATHPGAFSDDMIACATGLAHERAETERAA